MLEHKLVNMDLIIGELAAEYGIPRIPFGQLVKLGQHVVIVYNLDAVATKITFDHMCELTKQFISTPFGRKILKEIMM